MTFRGFIFGALVVVLVGSIALRAATHTSSAGAALDGAGTSTSTNAFAGSQTGSTTAPDVTPATTTPTQGETLLPYLTEGSFFGIIGFALGYTSRKIVKLLLILVALVFAAIQGLAVAGIVSDVDWGKALTKANDLIFNFNEHQTVIEFLKAKIPSAGAFLGGFVLGFRKG